MSIDSKLILPSSLNWFFFACLSHLCLLLLSSPKLYSVVLFFHLSPLSLFPASQRAFIFPRLDYCKALSVCQHSWKLFISALIHLGRQRENRGEVEGNGEWESCRGCFWRQKDIDTEGKRQACLVLWISEPLVVNLHCNGLMGNFPVGLLAVCETPTQSWEHTSLGTHKYAHMDTCWLKKHKKNIYTQIHKTVICNINNKVKETKKITTFLVKNNSFS